MRSADCAAGIRSITNVTTCYRCAALSVQGAAGKEWRCARRDAVHEGCGGEDLLERQLAAPSLPCRLETSHMTELQVGRREHPTPNLTLPMSAHGAARVNGTQHSAMSMRLATPTSATARPPPAALAAPMCSRPARRRLLIFRTMAICANKGGGKNTVTRPCGSPHPVWSRHIGVATGAGLSSPVAPICQTSQTPLKHSRSRVFQPMRCVVFSTGWMLPRWPGCAPSTLLHRH